jgi:ABC-type nitrate/sulfonate/bicarbonate transport system permease component
MTLIAHEKISEDSVDPNPTSPGMRACSALEHTRAHTRNHNMYELLGPLTRTFATAFFGFSMGTMAALVAAWIIMEQSTIRRVTEIQG